MPYSTLIKDAALLEGLLFLSGRSMSVDFLAAHTGWSKDRVETAAETLENRLSDAASGITLLRVAGGYQLATKAELNEDLHWEYERVGDLSAMAMEVLAIIAFRQPVTRADIEKMRGVSSERSIQNLLQQGLIVDLGRKESPGRPILYGTSPYFLECLGIDSLEELAAHVPAPETEAVLTDAGRREGGEDHGGTVAESDE